MSHQFRCTVWFKDDFDAGAMAEKIKEAMDGCGTNEDVILDILGNHCNKQLMELVEAYKVAYGEELIDDIKSELRGDFETLCVALLQPPRMYDVRELHEAVSGAGTDETALVEIMTMRSNSEMCEIKELYKAEYDVELEEDLMSDTGGYFKRMMVSLCAGGRESDDWWDYGSEEWEDDEEAAVDAQKLIDAGEGCWGTEEAAINKVLCLSSPRHLYKVLHAYRSLAGKTLEEAIDSECSGSLKEGYLAIIEGVQSKPRYFARRLHECFAGLGTNDNDLIRIIVTRAEVDLEDIKDEYQRLYDKSLAEAVEDECSGDYKRLLLALIRVPE